ncbi:Os08g0200001 [Oryza sativa Japonica Group]|uniref:Os08g0200001 protein n=1 Tax=Oryza sativa subsp. japonica TaxID=39947 RepID=C7J5T4_ORYSJ|nr:Os08g0200001 [Oryza sativa Japonica Group]|eukprot:NP_001175428.1 Os08g0200001 [Oryza sativa Japonica Group]
MGTERKRMVSLFDVVDESSVSTKLGHAGTTNSTATAAANPSINWWTGRPYSARSAFSSATALYLYTHITLKPSYAMYYVDLVMKFFSQFRKHFYPTIVSYHDTQGSFVGCCVQLLLPRPLKRQTWDPREASSPSRGNIDAESCTDLGA